MFLLLEEHPPNREEHDPDIEERVPVRDVVKIELNAFSQRRITAPTIHLGPPSHPSFHSMTSHVIGDGFGKLADELRLLRSWPHEAHVTPEYIE